MFRRFRSLGVLLLLVVGCLFGGCGDDGPRADLVYLVTTLDGSIASDDKVRRVTNEMDTRLLEHKHARRNVTQLPEGKVRVVLPEADLPNMDEVRTFLEGGEFWADELNVKLTLVGGYGSGGK